MASSNTNESRRVTVGPGRLSYPRLFEPEPVDPEGKGAPKYSLMILIPKEDTKSIKKIKRAQQAALDLGASDGTFGGKAPKAWSSTLHDCDEEDDLEAYPERANHYRIAVTAPENNPPNVVDRSVSPITDRSEIYPGCWVNVSMQAFPFSVSGNKGISFGLRNVQKVDDGEPFGAVSRPEDDFDPYDDDDDDEDDII